MQAFQDLAAFPSGLSSRFFLTPQKGPVWYLDRARPWQAGVLPEKQERKRILV